MFSCFETWQGDLLGATEFVVRAGGNTGAYVIDRPCVGHVKSEQQRTYLKRSWLAIYTAAACNACIVFVCVYAGSLVSFSTVLAMTVVYLFLYRQLDRIRGTMSC